MLRTALVVDDSMLIRHAVCRFFERHEFLVESVSDGVEALEALQTIRPDVIVTDLSMPKMTGTELITALKEKAETKDTPIIVLASKRTASEPMSEARANFVIFKDIDIEEQLERAVTSIFVATR